MKRDTLSAIKFRGITSSVLSICCYLIIWACCELLHGITMRGFFAAAAAIVAVIFTSMSFKLWASKMISDISASKVFNTYRAMFFAYVIYAALLGAMLFYSLNYTGLDIWDYALQQMAALSRRPLLHDSCALCRPGASIRDRKISNHGSLEHRNYHADADRYFHADLHTVFARQSKRKQNFLSLRRDNFNLGSAS